MSKKVVTRVDRNLARRLWEARREVGYSTRGVAERLPHRLAVSHATIASYEKGASVPAVDVLGALADLYQRPLNWFLDSRDTIGVFRYWNMRARTPVAKIRQFEAQTGKWADAYMKLHRHLRPDGRRNPSTLEEANTTTPKEFASYVRSHVLNLDDDQPIDNVISVFESFSAWAIEISSSFGAGGAVTRIGKEYVVAVSPDLPGDQVRIHIANELGRFLYDEDSNNNHSQEQTYRFACALLLPHSQLREAFSGRSFLKLIRFKEKFGVSLAAMIHMAESDRIINSTTSRWLWSQMTHRNWKANEPGHVWRDRAITFETLLDCAIQDKRVSWTDAERITGVCENDLKDRLESVLERLAPKTKDCGDEWERAVTLKLTTSATDRDV